MHGCGRAVRHCAAPSGLGAAWWHVQADGSASARGAYPRPGDVRLCLVAIPSGTSAEAAGLRLLSADERDRAACFRRDIDALRYIATRARLRLCLASALDVPPGTLQFCVDAGGRPMLAGEHAGRLDFNVSHSGGFGLIAWSAERRVGVDIERREFAWRWQALLDSACGEGDRAWLARQPPGRRAARFYDVWAAKEALLKAHGSGISAGLAHFSIAPGRKEGASGCRLHGAPPLWIPTNEGSAPMPLHGYRAHSLPGIAGYAACVSWAVDRGTNVAATASDNGMARASIRGRR